MQSIPCPNIIENINQDLRGVSPKQIQNFQLIRAKSGVYVYKGTYGCAPVVVKYFENEGDRREILNYRILARHGIPTIKTLALAETTLVMEDISVSEDWRLGIAEDLEDTTVAKCLAKWYFTFHENGCAAPELDTLYFEFDSITEDNLKVLTTKLPEATELFHFLLTHYEKMREIIYKPSFTLSYNDFYWTNFVVRKDKTAAMMFDYNLMGKGYRFSDIRNACWPMSDDAKAAFSCEYNRLYVGKHKHTRAEAEKLEARIDDVMGPIFSLFTALTQHENLPNWAIEYKNDAISGSLLSKAKQLLH